MSRNGELDSLKAKEQEAFRQKQAAYQRYEEAKKLTNSAYINMQSAWNDRCSAREVMNSEYEAMQASNSTYREVWAEYSRIRDGNNTRIQQLRSDSDHEHRMMQDCFERASFAYTSGDKAEASSLSAEGRSHKERRDSINAEVSSLSYEIRSAKMSAESRAPKTDGSAFRSAKSVFNEAKSCHESAQAEFNRLKAERDRLKAEFDTAQKRFLQYKEEFQKKLAEVKAKNQQERDRILDKAGITGAERADAKIVKKADGTIQVYHGGFGPGDGFGHGHTAIDQSGVITYDRDAFESHGAQNYTDHEERKQGGILAYDRDAFESHSAQNHTDHQEGKRGDTLTYDRNARPGHEEGKQGGILIYDRNARPGHEVKGISGGIKLRENSSYRGEGQDWYSGKKPGVIGHSTQFYADGVRVSRETRDGMHEENIHWTDERLPSWHPDYHKKPKD